MALPEDIREGRDDRVGRREGPVAVPGQRALRRAKAERAEVPRDVGGGFGFVQTTPLELFFVPPAPPAGERRRGAPRVDLLRAVRGERGDALITTVPPRAAAPSSALELEARDVGAHRRGVREGRLRRAQTVRRAADGFARLAPRPRQDPRVVAPPRVRAREELAGAPRALRQVRARSKVGGGGGGVVVLEERRPEIFGGLFF